MNHGKLHLYGKLLGPQHNTTSVLMGHTSADIDNIAGGNIVYFAVTCSPMIVPVMGNSIAQHPQTHLVTMGRLKLQMDKLIHIVHSYFNDCVCIVLIKRIGPIGIDTGGLRALNIVVCIICTQQPPEEVHTVRLSNVAEEFSNAVPSIAWECDSRRLFICGLSCEDVAHVVL